MVGSQCIRLKISQKLMKQVLNPGLANFKTSNFIFPMPKRNQSKFYGREKRRPNFVHNNNFPSSHYEQSNEG